MSPKGAQSAINATYAGSSELWAGETHLNNYNNDLIAKLTKYSKGATQVLEFGAGIGTLANLWKRSTGVEPQCVEIDPQQRSVIERRGFRCYENLATVEEMFDLIYTSNVLEHIEDDGLVLRQLNSKIRHGGFLAVYVPASPMIYSRFDEKVGHYRRYKKRDLLMKIREAGFLIEDCYFADSIGFFAWLYLKMKGDMASDAEERNMRVYDRYIFPISKFFDALGCKHLFGKNIFVYARKP